MIADITHKGTRFRVDLSRPLDLSLPMAANAAGPRAWHVGPVRMEPVEAGGRTYLISAGAPVNFRNIAFNPHGHGTHTESVGHIDDAITPVGGLLTRFLFTSQVISVQPGEQRQADGTVDHVITREQLQGALQGEAPEAVVLRTLPNTPDKRSRDWTGTNPPYLEAGACAWLRGIGVMHLLLDLPSVDREEDGGALAAHHAFWDHPATADRSRTITELLFVPDDVPDGAYLLELQFPHLLNDASPSRPVLYALLP